MQDNKAPLFAYSTRMGGDLQQWSLLNKDGQPDQWQF
jgi:hypothetical protein